jgi:DNA repair photolyase
MKKICQYIERKTLIYKTAVEYGDYTINHVLGCSHGCLYPCYAYLMAKRFGKVKSYDEWIEPRLVSNTLELLEKEIPKYKDKINTLHLCFSTDPFMYGYEEITAMSLEIMKRLNANGIKCSALTKGLLPTELARLSKDNEYGITLISLDEDFRIRMEPQAAPYQARIESLRKLHQLGCKTWVSIEPYPTPNIIKQNLSELLNTVAFTNKIIFGRTNYNAEVTRFIEHKEFYNEQSKQVIDFCAAHRIAYHIKKGTISE